MKKQTKRADLLKRGARVILKLYRRTGGKGPEWRKAIHEFDAMGPWPPSEWLEIFAHGVRAAERRSA